MSTQKKIQPNPEKMSRLQGIDIRFKYLLNRQNWKDATWFPLPSPSAVFIHIPKAAGTSVSSWIESQMEFFAMRSRAIPKDKPRPATPYCLYLGHMNSDVAVSMGVVSPKQLEKSYSFMFVRNPFTRAISLYRHLVRHDAMDGTFSDFLRGIRDPYFFKDQNLRRRAISMGRPMTHWYQPKSWYGPETIHRFEDLSGGMNLISAELGLEPADVRRGVSPHTQTLPSLNSGDVREIQDLYRKDFENFGYPFEPPGELHVE